MNKLWGLVWAALICTLGPFTYGSFKVHLYLSKHAPPGYELISFADVPQMVVGIFVFGIIQRTVLLLSAPFFKTIVKG